MENELPQPYTTDEIQSRPYAVIISLLIGLLIVSVYWNIQNDRTKNERIDVLTDRADAEKQKRIEMYETMLFYKRQTERLEHEQSADDSLLRERTEPFVHRILNHE
jgi:hypothetical protein